MITKSGATLKIHRIHQQLYITNLIILKILSQNIPLTLLKFNMANAPLTSSSQETYGQTKDDSIQLDIQEDLSRNKIHWHNEHLDCNTIKIADKKTPSLPKTLNDKKLTTNHAN